MRFLETNNSKKKNKWILLTWIHYLYWCGCNKVK